MENRIIFDTVHRWLLLLGAPINKRYLREKLTSHSYFPSALCITSLLNELGIENSAAKIEMDQVPEIANPFLAHIKGEEFLLVTPGEKSDFIRDYRSRWNGVVIMAEKAEKFTPPEEVKKYDWANKEFITKWTFFLSIFAILFGIFTYRSSLWEIALLLLALIGLVNGIAVVLLEFGIGTIVSRQLCGEGENTGCHTMVDAKASNLPLDIKLSDVVVSFFSGIVFLLCINSFATKDFRSLSLLFIFGACYLSVPLTLFSLYYQWRVMKKWCTSCILIIVSIWLMLLLQAQFVSFATEITFSMAVACYCILVFPGAVWFLIRTVLNRQQEVKSANMLLMRIYKNPELLQAYFQTQEKIDTTPAPCDFQIGNAHAPCQILVVSSHSCGNCSETHGLLQQMLVKHKDQLGITVRYMISSDASKNEIVTHMLAYGISTKDFFQSPEKILKMLNIWYQTMDIKKFKTIYPLAGEINIDAVLKQQRDWLKVSNIQFTPAILINGYQLKGPYSANDLLELGGPLIEIFSTEEYMPVG